MLITTVLGSVISNNWSTSLAIRSASSIPPLPVTAFAQPLLATRALIPLPPRFASMSLDTTTGAALKTFFVKTAAAEAGRSDITSAKSSDFPSFLTPQWIPPTR